MANQTTYPPYARVNSYIDASPKGSFDVGNEERLPTLAAATGPGGSFADYSDPQGGAARRYQRRQQDALTSTIYPGAASAELDGGSTSKSLFSGKRKWIWAGLVCFIVLAVGIGAGVGVSVSEKNASTSISDLSTSSTNSTTGNSSDPSVFTLDPRLTRSFWGIAYEPESVQVPACGALQANVTRDVQLLSQLTPRIRMYGSNCNQTALVLQAIQDTKVDLGVYLAVYIDSDTTTNAAQWAAIQDALTTYGTENILGIAIGNEYILDSVDQTSGTTDLLAQIQTYNTSLIAMGLNTTIPMGTSDAGSVFTLALAEGVDFFHANVHPWFGNVSIDDAAGWTYTFFQEFDIAVANQVTTRSVPALMIGETGWPTQSLDIYSANDGPSLASLANLQIFLDTYVCQANANGTLAQTFMFEFRDANWKAAEYGGVEPFWGLFDDSTVVKNLTMPNCPV